MEEERAEKSFPRPDLLGSSRRRRSGEISLSFSWWWREEERKGLGGNG
jgi:hypothetical protein